MRYRISHKAKEDLEHIWLYTYEVWSGQQADRYFNLIMEEIDHIAKNPQSGKDYGKVKKGYFRSRIKSHFIFYKVNKKEALVEIIRVLHQRMDIESQLE